MNKPLSKAEFDKLPIEEKLRRQGPKTEAALRKVAKEKGLTLEEALEALT